ncbi:FecR family protein [Chitinophaga alhagiae]|uniref:FecR family protein n=1 Tax=Chitinophaga alhagiae TaxID=2203219 RepID=UPI0018E56D00|nr:FecR family protein [Chitinophaga alhagiae]
MDQQRFSALLEKYLSEDLSREEAARLLDSLENEEMRQQWEEAIGALLANRSVHGLSDPARMQAVRKSITARPAFRIRKILPYAAAAAVAALAIAGLAYLFRPVRVNAPVAKHTSPLQVMPGGNKAVLTLADGSHITLDSAGNGAIASQGNVQVVKTGSGQLAYNAGSGSAGSEVSYNVLSTPRGGQYKVILPDGTEVWLNAASTLRFPTAFTGKAREVQLNGEAYFEVARNEQMPFSVKVKDMEVQVLGTHFNVMAYHDERSIQTTLLEGAVNVRHGGERVRLAPGQQARLGAEGRVTVNNNVDVEEVVAWKNGYFHFNRESLEGVMRQVSRWYDAEVTYEGQGPVREFGGKISRSSSITEVLKILEMTKVQYRIEGKKIIITQ